MQKFLRRCEILSSSLSSFFTFVRTTATTERKGRAPSCFRTMDFLNYIMKRQGKYIFSYLLQQQSNKNNTSIIFQIYDKVYNV